MGGCQNGKITKGRREVPILVRSVERPVIPYGKS